MVNKILFQLTVVTVLVVSMVGVAGAVLVEETSVVSDVYPLDDKPSWVKNIKNHNGDPTKK